MWKLSFFVNCDGWRISDEFGRRGYDNMIYFTTRKEAKEWLLRQSNVDLIELILVPVKDFAEDVILY